MAMRARGYMLRVMLSLGLLQLPRVIQCAVRRGAAMHAAHRRDGLTHAQNGAWALCLCRPFGGAVADGGRVTCS